MIREERVQSQLPVGWTKARVDDICDLINGRAFKPSEWASIGIPIIRIQNLNDPSLEFNYCNFSIEQKFLVDNGQLLFAWSGTPGTSFGAHIWNRGKAALNQHIFKVNINEKYLDKIFLKHLLNHNIGEYIAKAHGTAGLAHITKGKFEESQINLPPFNEQKRIANKIEELFSFLDVGVESLRKVKAQLKCYRQAVLKYAFEGKLTEEWRKTHKDQIEPATKLLERIGQASKNKEQKSPVQSREKQSSIDLPELPESWVWTTIGDLIIDARYGTSKKCYSEPDGVPVLRIPNIVKERLDFTDLKYTHLSDEEVERISLKFGDILIVRTNGSLEFIGRATTVGEQQNNYTFASYLIRLRPVIADILPRYLVLFLSSEIGRKTIQRRARTTAGQFNINLDALRSIPIPLSSLTEQEKIIEDIDRHFSFVDETEKTMSICIEISEHLRQSILKVVFEGKLIPQDPTDEPAEKLLERIMGERVKQIKTETRNKNDLGQVELVRFVK